ncbi:MAG: uridine phosphorylase [Oscillospiraceae bacterium]|nr:uridine phosphorylase [Oscillospiraceae bacterium]
MSEVANMEKKYHINLSKADLCGARYAIMPGDPGRVPKIAELLDNPRQVAYNREYNTYIGELEGATVAVTSHGIGGPSTAIAVEELHQCGVDTFVRIGTSGGMQLDVKAGDVAILTGAIRAEGTSREYLPIEFPAVADIDVTCALRKAARDLKIPYHVGVGQCKDSFYGQHEPERMPVSYELLNKWQAWVRGGALVSEMESAALYTVCATLRARAGAVMLCCWNQEREAAGLPQDKDHDTERAIKVAVGGIRNLILQDREN